MTSIQQKGRVDIIANDQGHRITPSWVSFSDEERLIGDAAKNAFHTNPVNTVFDAKRELQYIVWHLWFEKANCHCFLNAGLIGRNFDDPEVKRDQKHWPFKLINKSGKPSIQVKHKHELKEFVSSQPPTSSMTNWRFLTWMCWQTPEEISAMVLVKMKETAEAYLGKKVTHAVVTVPACTSCLPFSSPHESVSWLIFCYALIRLQRRPASSHQGCRYHRWSQRSPYRQRAHRRRHRLRS